MSAPFALPPLPYKPDALAPYVSANTLGFHHGKHHNAYVAKLNELVKGAPFESMDVPAIIVKTGAGRGPAPVFNNAAQAWNHEFYWKSLRPGGGGKPKGQVLSLIEKSFQSYDAFKEKLLAVSMGHFGSGWSWLVKTDGGVEIVSTGNADTPLAHGKKPLLTIDLWEHAYYLDYQNLRKSYLDAVLDHLLNWEFAEENL
jgi:Fe-Mn family superoxide dismutase